MKKAMSLFTRIGHVIYGERGQIYFNIAYSLGAAIVILGALFKILHLAGGNTLLLIGMGTEVVMFVLTAFDYKSVRDAQQGGGAGGSGVIIAGSASSDASVDTSSMPAHTQATGAGVHAQPSATGQTIVIAGATTGTVSGTAIAGQVSGASGAQAAAQPAAPRISAETVESYSKMADNAAPMAAETDTFVEQIQTLNRNITALNAMYEMQLRNVAAQVDTVESIAGGVNTIRDIHQRTRDLTAKFNEQSELLTSHMAQINDIYANMLRAMRHGEGA